MTNLDTNVLVRVLTRDHRAQAEAAAAVMRDGPTWVSRTVLLETECVLRYTYEFDRDAIASAFTALLGLDGLTMESRSEVRRAVEWYRQGLDFADALHLSAAPRDTREMVTFDTTFARRAVRMGALPTVRALTRPSR